MFGRRKNEREQIADTQQRTSFPDVDAVADPIPLGGRSGESGGQGGPAQSSSGMFSPDPYRVEEPDTSAQVEQVTIEGRHSTRLKDVRENIGKKIYQSIDFDAAIKLDREALSHEVAKLVAEISLVEGYRLTAAEQKEVASALVDDMIGLGPLEDLLEDESVTDIMVNGPSQVYVERNGKLAMTSVTFRDTAHVTAIAQRIAHGIGRHVDESSPMVDARLMDGSRVNIILPPLAVDGCSISIRKFARRKITLEDMIRQENVSEKLAKLLQVAAACRLNIIVSGGTGSGKTTLLNALSRLIDPRERIVTIEDAAEIQLQQPHVVRLETRPPNIEGQGAVTMRALLKNSLRMRPIES